MKLSSLASVGIAASFAVAAGACGANTGVQGSNALTRPNVPGTIFTIVFENHDQGSVLNSSMPYLVSLSQQYGSSLAYTGGTHPSLPNYLQMTSGRDNGIRDDGPPSAHSLSGTDNIADQLDAAHVPWRAYMEGMGDACSLQENSNYTVHHNPFLYYDNFRNDTARCQEHDVDFDQNFAADLASDQYRYMWITPNMCNDMHNCSPSVTDAWLQRVIPQIMASPGYQRGGAIFLLWDEGSPNLQYVLGYLFGTPQNLAAIVISPNLATPGTPSDIGYNHNSYLATVEDILGLPRLVSTVNSVPMSGFFTEAPVSNTTGGTNTTPTSGSNGSGGGTSP